jgi:hypothetical protein
MGLGICVLQPFLDRVDVSDSLFRAGWINGSTNLNQFIDGSLPSLSRRLDSPLQQ